MDEPVMQLCACGCGLPLSKPRYIQGHQPRTGRRIIEGYTVEDRGYETPCWIGFGTPDRAGYLPRHRYSADGRRRRTHAHRLAYEEAKGAVPRGMEIDHLCRVTSCVNPDHLEAVTHAENMRRSPGVKLTRAAVRDIRSTPPRVVSRETLAARYGVSVTTISLVRGRKIWADVE